MSLLDKSSSRENSPWENFTICLPHPYLTRYFAQPTDYESSYRIAISSPSSNRSSQTQPPFPLHSQTLSFSTAEDGLEIPEADNTAWDRVRRSPFVTFSWNSTTAPTIAQLWLLIYSLWTVHHTEETIRLKLVGIETALVCEELITVGLAIKHPIPVDTDQSSKAWKHSQDHEIVLLRSSFWQGAGSPFGPRSTWLPSSPPSTSASVRQPLSTFPALPTTQTTTTTTTSAREQTLHPIRPTKPASGSTIYSRYIPHLDENFSITALDYQNPSHLHLVHTWLNDPRVAAGWNKTGTLDQHRTHLKTLHEDPHILTMLANFDDTPFAYFEVYWAKEDDLGAHYNAGDWDRGRQSLVGNTAFRGPHRAHAWWPSLMHYMFLDEPRTDFVVGEPKSTNTRVLELDALHGFHVEKFVDLPQKRSAFVKCSRERYFELCTVGQPFAGSASEKAALEATKAKL